MARWTVIVCTGLSGRVIPRCFDRRCDAEVYAGRVEDGVIGRFWAGLQHVRVQLAAGLREFRLGERFDVPREQHAHAPVDEAQDDGIVVRRATGEPCRAEYLDIDVAEVSRPHGWNADGYMALPKRRPKTRCRIGLISG